MPAPLSLVLRPIPGLYLCLTLALGVLLPACGGDEGGGAACKCGPHSTCSAEQVCVCDAGFTADASGACLSAGCASDAACDDGDPCNGSETCADRVCLAGAPVACPAGQACMPDGSCACPRTTWDDDGTCRPIACYEDAECDDVDPCNGAESCGADLTCLAGEPLVCGAHAACDDGACACDPGFAGDPLAGCEPAACLDDADCDDGDPCNGAEACVDDECRPGAPLVCGAHAACDEGACACDPGHHGDPLLGCLVDQCQDDGGCDDGDLCNGAEACVGFECVPGAPVVCAADQVCDLFGLCVCPVGTVADDAGACVAPAGPVVSTFEAAPLGDDGVWKGADGSGGVTDGLALLHNAYDTQYQSWEGFALTNHTDSTTPGWENQYSAIAGAGAGGSSAYAVAYAGFSGPPTITFPGSPAGVWAEGVYVTNTTYAALSMREGDAFAKKFGGADGTDPDWFTLTFTGHDAAGAAVGQVQVYLADYRADDPSEDGILEDWRWVDLAPLGPIASLTLTFASSDMGEWGMNTPAYAALDDLTLRPLEAAVADFEQADLGAAGAWTGADDSGGWAEGGAWLGNLYAPEWGSFEGFALTNHSDTSTPGWANQLSAIAGGGAEGSTVYAVSYGSAASFSGFQPYISFTEAGEGVWVEGAFVTNTTYAYLSMRDGDEYAKKFGGAEGTDPDWFALSVTGLTAAGDLTGPVQIYLADFRAADAADDLLLDDWTWLDLRPLGRVTGLLFDLTSSDTGSFGMNTPAYFALDSLRTLVAR